MAVIFFATIYSGRQNKIYLTRFNVQPLSWASSAFGDSISLDTSELVIWLYTTGKH